MDNYELRFKQKSPQQTVAFIKDILSQLDIDVVEEWIAKNEIGTYSLRLYLNGAPGVGANGKGVTKEFALASAYAEFMERLQNMRMTPINMLVRIQERHGGFYFHPSERVKTAEELIDEGNSFILAFLRRRGKCTATRDEKISELLKAQKFDYCVLKQYGKFLCVPFYSIKEKTECWVPYFLCGLLYASNGMCAGNSMEEAVVQGLSEIYERNANTRVLTEFTALPDIPDESIARFPDVYRMYQILSNDKRFAVHIKDASNGGQFPVVVLILIARNTGKCGVKFGAHPNIGIALERVFTEAMQGVSAESFSRKGDLSFLNEDVLAQHNLINSYRTSDAQYPFQMLLYPPKYQYYSFDDNRACSNQQLMEVEIEKLLSKGYDILIADYSYSGFGSYHVIIPGFSELDTNDIESVDMLTEGHMLQYALGHPQSITPMVCRKLLSRLMESSGHVLENTLYHFTGLFSTYPYPGKEDYVDNLYLIAVCSLVLGEYQLASEAASFILKHIKSISTTVAPDYLMLSRYCDGMLVLGNHDCVIRYLRHMFDSDICDKYDELFKLPMQALVKLYPEIWLDSAYTEEFRTYEQMILRFKQFALEHQVDTKEALSQLRAISSTGDRNK